MSDEFQFQLNVALPPSEQFAKGDMINVRGNTAAEFLGNLQAMNEHVVQEAAGLTASIRAAWVVIRDAGGQVLEQRRNDPRNAPQAPANPQTGGYAQQPPNGQQNAPQAPQGGYQQQPQQQYDPSNGSYAPQQPQTDSNGVPTTPPPSVGPAPSCSHGVKQFLAKPYKNGKPGYWMAWACPSRDRNNQHPLEFIDQR